MSSRSAVISGTGTSVPERVVTNRDLEALVDTSDEWIVSRTGIRERRIAGDGEGASEHAARAGRRALDAAGIDPGEIDLIVLATVTPDMPIPASACAVQQTLGCKKAFAFDMQAGCSGFLYAQSVAKQFLLTGRARHALVIGAELLSKYLDWSDRATCVIFADGAGATVMGARDRRRAELVDGSAQRRVDGGIHHPAWRRESHPPTARTVEQGLHFIKMRATRRSRRRRSEELCGKRCQAGYAGRRRLVHPAPSQPADHRRGRERLAIGPERVT
jgi:3-oxoacyl-[acyl-carrier-protein] synthase-3